MADRSIPVLRASDATILKFFDALRDKHQFTENYNVYIVGSDHPLSIGGPQVDVIKKTKWAQHPQRGHFARSRACEL